MKLGELLNINTIIKNIIDGDNHIDYSFKFQLLGIMKQLENNVQNFDIIRNELIYKYGTKNEDGNYIINPDDHDVFDKFEKEINEVLEQEINIKIKKIKQEDVFNKGIPSDVLIRLYDYIEQ